MTAFTPFWRVSVLNETMKDVFRNTEPNLGFTLTTVDEKPKILQILSSSQSKFQNTDKG